MDLKVICLEETAFYELVEKVYNRLKEQNNIKVEKWISGEEAMNMLRITSKTTLLKYRQTGVIRFTQPDKKIILYDSNSINDFLNKHSHNTF